MIASKFILAFFYPLLATIWSISPLDKDNTQAPYSMKYLTNNELKQQATLYKQTTDSRIRVNMVRDLQHANNPYVFTVLLNNLKEEKNQDVIDEIFHTLYLFRGSYTKSDITIPASYLNSSSNTTRGYAIALQLLKHKNSTFLKKVLNNEHDYSVLSLVKMSIYEAKMSIPVECLTKRYQHAKKRETKLLFLELLGYATPNLDNNKTITSLLSSNELDSIVAILIGVSKREKVNGITCLTGVTRNSTPMVRATVVLAPTTPGMDTIFIASARDAVADTRAKAIQKLSNYKTKKVIELLISKMRDPDRSVRDAVEASLLKLLTPQDELYIKNIAGEVAGGGNRDVSITLLGRLKCKRKAAEMLHYFKEKHSDETRARMILYFKEVVYKEALPEIRKYEHSKSAKIRQAVAQTYGAFNLPATFPALIKLSQDSNVEVIKQSILAMGQLKNGIFQKRLDIILSDFAKPATLNSDVRSYAIWATSKINKPTPKTATFLGKLITKKVIPTMVGPVFDADYVRASALLALIDMKQEKAFKKSFKLTTNPLNASENSATMVEYLRQVKYYKEKKATRPAIIPQFTPDLTVKPIQ